LPKVLAPLHARHPNLLLTVEVVRPPEIATVLKSGQLEALLGTLPLHAPEIEFEPLFDSPLKIVVSSKHRWAAQGCSPGLDSQELAKEPCLLPNRSDPTRHLIDRYFAAANIVLNGIADLDSIDLIKEILIHGIGMSILPDWAVKDELGAGLLAAFPPGRRHLRQCWGLLRLRGRPVTPIGSSFQVFCSEAAKSLQSTN
jgi:DNA-binding transcriptional LysR family regulator